LSSGSSYVDNEYYKNFAKEDLTDLKNPEYKNYPVNVQGISIDWIINTDEENDNGMKFL